MIAGPDLSGHGILEAHAGTGKTFTIVGMVLTLLEKERLQLRDILLVTYTQKAAGELVGRIRKGIAERADAVDDPDLEAHLRACLGQLGECWIGTIHGVALRILRTWPFESGLPFRTELVDDDDGLESAAREVWRRNPWGLLPDDLEEIAEGGALGPLFARALDLARGRLDPDMVLIPDGSASREDLERWRDAVRRWRGRLDELETDLQEADASFVPWLRERAEAFERLDREGFTKGFEGACATAFRSWSSVLQRGRSRDPKDPRGKTSSKPVSEAAGKKDLSHPVASEALRLLEEVVAEWTRLYDGPLRERKDAESGLASSVRELRSGWLASWALSAATAWKERKRDEGLVSYADMLERLRDALEDTTFREVLRRRIRVGIIDEFQDTSALQWDIFRRWFLDDNPGRDPRLHVVGDPKQSIYSFQGADVRTYLAACERLRAEGAATFPLRSNWRSLPRLVEATNNLLVSLDLFGPGIRYDRDNQVATPPRATHASGDAPEPRHPIGLLAVEGSAGAKRAAWARAVAGTIREWMGREVVLPDGARWRRRTLSWGDFAVVVQTRTGVPAFRRAFREAGIPWALYKEQGVFVSRAARELRAVLAAIDRPNAEEGDRIRALLTRFFGVGLERIDPAVHLGCGHPAADLLDDLASLAESRRWSRLFRELRVRTGVESRILSGVEGDRQWMDLRQVMDEALSFLVEGRGGLPQLVEHLDRLARERIDAAEDRNLHARATDRARVQVLTMHVSKGLEFPFVFLAPSTPSSSREEPRWIDEAGGRMRLHVATKESGDNPLVASQRAEELGRLFYVALTRAKLFTGLPVSRGGKPDPLSARLEAMSGALPEGCGWMDLQPIPDPLPSAPSGAERAAAIRIGPERIAALDLPSRQRFLSSYSAISASRSSPGLEGRRARSEEASSAIASSDSVPAAPPADGWLPRGARTGDCLHELLESLLAREDLSWCADPESPSWFPTWIARSLRLHGIDPSVAPELGRLLRRILSSPLPLGPKAGSVRLCDLPVADRRPETEFHCAIDPDGRLVEDGPERSGDHRGWLVGYIDLLFRHEGAWHVLDWKTTSLPDYAPESLEAAMDEHDYRFQSSLYAHVLSRVAGSRPGGSVYVFIRAAAGDLDARTPLPGVWSTPASPEDGRLSRERIAAWLAARGSGRARREEDR